MTDKLNEIFETIKGWTVEEIQSILYHREWTQRKTIPFEKSGKSEIDPKLPPESFDERRASFAKLLKQKSHDVDAEQSAKIIICSTFLLVNDETIDGHDKFSQIRSRDGVHSKLLELLDEMDSTTHWESIQKRQLFYALLKQREEESFTIKKVTWKNVTSDWGPKIVMSDGKDYYYIFSNIDKETFETLRKRYNIAAALGRAEQYESDYDKDENEFNLKIIKVLATKDCLTLAEYFKQQKIGLKGNSSGKRLFEKLGDDFFRKELNTEMVRKSDELKKILPRLIQNEKGNACLDAILGPDKKWRIPRTQIRVGKQTYFAVHGDEWGGNFLVAKAARQVFVIDFEDVIYANANDEENIVGVGGDLSTRIFNATKDGHQTFLPIGLSTFASIGRLLAAVVQYHSRYNELQNNNIREIIHNYLESFAKALDESSDDHHVVESNYWDTDLEQLILLHAWDWALYWRKKDAFPPESFEVFVKEIKNLLCEGHADKADSTHKSAPPDATKIEKMPSENRDAQAKKTFNDKSIKLANDAAWGHYTDGDFAEAEEGWRHAIQLVPDSTSTEDLGYFWYWMTRALYLNNGDESSAIESILRCIEFCKAEDDDVWLMEALLVLAHLHLEEDENVRARLVLNQVVGLHSDKEFEEEPDSFDLEHLLAWPGDRHRFYSDTVLCQIKRQVANLLWDEDDLGGAAILYENLMNYYKGTMKHDAEDNARVNLGILKSFMGEYEESDALQNQCLDYRRKVYVKLDDGDTREITKALRNLGQNAMAWKKYDKAKQYFADCIFELRKVPNELVHPDIIENYIVWNQENLKLCEILHQIKLLHLHNSKREDKIEQLGNLADKSSTHFEQCLPHLLRLIHKVEDCIPDHQFKEITKFSNYQKLETTNLLIKRFGQYKRGRDMLLSIDTDSLDYNQKVQVCEMYEEIHFSENGNKMETLEYHDKLEQEYSIQYSSIFDNDGPQKEDIKETIDRLDKYQTRLLSEAGVVDVDIYDDLDDESFREILTYLFDSNLNPKQTLLIIQAQLSGHLWPYQKSLSRATLLSVIEKYSMDILTNIDIIWNSAQSTFDEINAALNVSTAAMASIARSKQPQSRKKSNFAKSRYIETTNVIEAWYSKPDIANKVYKNVCRLVTERSIGMQLDMFSNLIPELIKIKDSLSLQNGLFTLLTLVWTKSRARYEIELKKSGYLSYEEKVVEFARNLCIWIKDQPEKIDLTSAFDGSRNRIEEDHRLFLARKLMDLYGLQREKTWPFDVLHQ
jgi:TolA-binding protein